MLFLHVEENPSIAKMFVFMGHVVRAEEVPEKLRRLAVSVDTIAFCQNWVREGQKDKSIREGDVLSLSNMYWCVIHGIMEQYALCPEILLPKPCVDDRHAAKCQRISLFHGNRFIKEKNNAG